MHRVSRDFLVLQNRVKSKNVLCSGWGMNMAILCPKKEDRKLYKCTDLYVLKQFCNSSTVFDIDLKEQETS